MKIALTVILLSAWTSAGCLPAKVVKYPHIRDDSVILAIDRFDVDHGRPPDSLDELLSPGVGDHVWKGPYIANTNALYDPWRHPFRYTRQGDDYTMHSSGPDGLFGTEDDITN